VSGITGKPKRTELLAPTGSKTLSFGQKGPLLHIQLPAEQPDPFVSVVRVDYDSISIDPKIVAESTFGGFALTPHNASNAEMFDLAKYDGKRPARAHVAKGEKMLWEVYAPAPGYYSVDLSAHNGTGTDIPVSIRFAGSEMTILIAPDGKVVAEPNENNHTDEFVDHRMDRIYIDRPGRYVLEFEAQGAAPLWFHRIWVESAFVVDN